MESTTNHSSISKSFYKKDQLDLDYWFKIAQIDYEKLIEQYPFQKILAAFGKPQINLLDIGCGTGRFPSLLDDHISGDIHLSSDILDVSEYCLQEAQQVLDSCKHFSPNQIYLSELEKIDSIILKTRVYDLIWAIHSLYMVDKEKIGYVFDSCLKLLSPNGIFLIYGISKNSFYYEIYDFYLKCFPESINNQRFTTTEDCEEILSSLGLNYQTQQIIFNHIVDYDQQSLLKLYLNKCVLNHDADVLFLFEDWLSKYLDKESNQYKFPQLVNLLIIKNMPN
jgi:SAM-dependent methyltransferase